MSPEEIRSRVARLDTRRGADSEAAWTELRPLREAVVPYLYEEYRRARRAELRVALVFHAIGFARTSEPAVALGLAALDDRATLVRYRACGLLAYSLRREAPSKLRACRPTPISAPWPMPGPRSTPSSTRITTCSSIAITRVA